MAVLSAQPHGTGGPGWTADGAGKQSELSTAEKHKQGWVQENTYKAFAKSKRIFQEFLSRVSSVWMQRWLA